MNQVDEVGSVLTSLDQHRSTAWNADLASIWSACEGIGRQAG